MGSANEREDYQRLNDYRILTILSVQLLQKMDDVMATFYRLKLFPI